MLRKQIYLCDKDEKDLFALHGSIPPPTEQAKLAEWLNEKNTWDEKTQTAIGKSRKDIIIEIEKKYPGLFIPIFVNDNSKYHYAYDDMYVNSI